jgi:RimJ/RimL family protein N-acetyltransferase
MMCAAPAKPGDRPVSPDFTRKATLTGDLVTLRPARRSDAAVLHSYLGDREVSRLTGASRTSSGAGQPGWTVEQLEEIYDRWSTADDRIVWVIIDNSTGNVAGESVLNDLDPHSRWCNFRIWISGARDRGLGTEATRLTLRHAFEEQRLNRVELQVYDFNPRARHVYEKVGFVLEGTKRQVLLFDGAWVDAHDMAILAGEWNQHHGHPAST